MLWQGGLGATQGSKHGFEQAVDDIPQAQSLAGGVGQGQAGRFQGRGVKVTGAHLTIADFPFRQQGVAQPPHRFDRGQHDQATQRVVEQVKADDQLLRAETQRVHPCHQRVQHRDDQHQADQLVQQAAQGHPTPGGVLHAGTDEGQQPAADVGADHQPDGYRQADQFGAGQCRCEQNGGQAGIGNHGEHCPDQSVEHDVAGQ
ncbi:hypothetical protein D3C79_638310 [compost metagenome]